MEDQSSHYQLTPRRYVLVSVGFLLLHVFFMLYRYGQLPIAPVLGDEVIINDASVSLARGHGYAARSFSDSKYGLDHVFAHFPPIYPYTEALAFRLFGVSVYSLRLTTTLMSIVTTVILVLLLRQLCRARQMDWDVAILITALYCTNTSLISFDRTARMESMVGFFVLLSLWAIFLAATRPPGKPTWHLTVAAGVLGAFSIAVHPEAVTALLLIGSLILFLAPGKLVVRIASVGLFAMIPVVVGLLIYGPQLFAAVHQFLAIAHDATSTEPTSGERIMQLLQDRSLTSINRYLFLESIILLLAIVPLSYFWVIRRLPRTSLRFRLGTCIGIVAVLELLLMVFVFRMSDRRYQFLFGPLLMCDALCLLGAAPLRQWQRAVGWALVCVQCLIAGVYLSGRHHEADDMNPDRYMQLVRRLPPGVSIASTPGLWLDFQEAERPFTLLYYGLDGENVWNKGASNPLDRFDVVILEDFYAIGRPWWELEAKDGRTRYSYIVGSHTVDIYLRPNLAFQSSSPRTSN